MEVLVRPTGFEPAAYRVGVCHSIQLSYERKYSTAGSFLSAEPAKPDKHWLFRDVSTGTV